MTKSLLWKKMLYTLAVFAIFILATSVSAHAQEIPNPIHARSFADLVAGVARAVQYIALVFAPIAFIFAGFKFILAAAQGNEADLKKARSMLGWIFAGTAVVVAATALATAIVNFAKTL